MIRDTFWTQSIYWIGIRCNNSITQEKRQESRWQTYAKRKDQKVSKQDMPIKKIVKEKSCLGTEIDSKCLSFNLTL